MIDLRDVPVVDVHCHPFLNHGPLAADGFTNLAAFTGGNNRRYMEAGDVDVDDAVEDELQEVQHSTVYFHRLVRDLAGFFGVEPTIDAVIDARNAAINAGYHEYVARLWGDAQLESVVMDFGYPVPNLALDAVREELPIQVVPIFRVEPLIVSLLAEGVAWSEFRQRYDDAIADALSNGGYRGLKSVIAYRTGLDISPLSRTPDQGYQALDAIHRGTGGGAMKKLRDHLLCRALELCIDHDVPMQIHTGMGDYEVNLVLSRPSYLMDLLRFPAYRACRVILVHTGYPYHREAGYLANVLPRVYCDLSEGIPFAGHGAKRIIAETLEMAPLNKVMYGSDGFSVPEINYTSAKLGKQALSDALQELVDGGMLGEADAREAGAMILAKNAQKLYGIQ